MDESSMSMENIKLIDFIIIILAFEIHTDETNIVTVNGTVAKSLNIREITPINRTHVLRISRMMATVWNTYKKKKMIQDHSDNFPT